MTLSKVGLEVIDLLICIARKIKHMNSSEVSFYIGIIFILRNTKIGIEEKFSVF